MMKFVFAFFKKHALSLGTFDRVSFAIRVSPVFKPSHMGDFHHQNIADMQEKHAFALGNLSRVSFAIRVSPVFKPSHMGDKNTANMQENMHLL